jgi:hypothetical protein
MFRQCGLTAGRPHPILLWSSDSEQARGGRPVADLAFIYDNSDEGRILVVERTPQEAPLVHDAARWAMIEKAAP